MKVLKIDTACHVSDVEITGDLRAALDKAYNGICEHVRPMRLLHPFCMLVDEDGRYKELPINLVGSYLYGVDIHGTEIVGDVYIAKDEMTREGYATTGLTDADIVTIRQMIEPIASNLAERSGV